MATYTPIGATAAMFEPQQAQVGNFLQVCARFNDNIGNREGPHCVQSASTVTNVNDAPTGLPALVQVTTPGNSVNRVTDDNGMVLPAPSSLPQHQQFISVLSTAGGAADFNSGPVMDEDGLPEFDRRAFWTHSIQRSTAASGMPWAEAQYSSGASATAGAYTISEADVAAGFMRTCVFYVDNHGTLEGVRGRSPVAVTMDFNPVTEITPAERLNGLLCSDPVSVTDVNTAPSPGESTVSVFNSATAEFPYIFTLDDFPFTDTDVPDDPAGQTSP